MDGTVHQVVRFERHFDQPVEAVWAALTQRQWLAQWLAVADIDGEADGGGGPPPDARVSLRFQNTGAVVTGRVSRSEAPYVLEYALDDTQFPEVLPREALRLPARGQLVSDGTCGGNWTDSFIRWELQAADAGGTNLVLTHSIPITGPSRRVRLDDTLAGWHNHLDLLANVLSTRPGERQASWQWGRHEGLRQRYAAEIGG